MAREQDTVTDAKLDTRLFVDGTLTTDLSQYLTDLTASGAGAFELNSTRTQLTGPRTVSVRWTATAAEAGVVLIAHGNTAKTDFTYIIGTLGDGRFCCHQNNTQIFAAAAAVAAKDYTVSWSLRANPDTTVAGDAMISEITIYNHTDAVIEEIEQVTHALPTSDPTWELGIGGWYDGVSLTQPPTNAVTNARVSSSAHTHTEALSDWAGSRPAYTGTPDLDEPVGPIPVAAGLGAVGYFAGRSPWGYTARHARAMAKRNWAPLVNETWSSDPVVNSDVPTNWLAGAPDSPTYQLMVQTLRWVPVPVGATHAHVRVQLKSVPTAGGPHLVKIRAYAMNRLPQQQVIGGQPAPALEHYYREVSVTRDDTGTDGLWSDLGLVRLPAFAGTAAGWRGTVQLALAWKIVSADEDLQIRSWHVVPVTQAMIGVVDP
jgi:hypothetical protein